MQSDTMSELKMYIVINKDLKMSKGKIASQVGHATMLVTEYLIKFKPKLYQTYRNLGMPKIVLQADTTTIDKLSTTINPNFVVYDAGRTQIPIGSLTTIAFIPMTEHKILSSLKLL